MLEVAEGNRDKMGDTQRQYTSSGTVDTSTRETEVSNDTGEGKSWAMWDPDSDSLLTAWIVGLCEKPCAY